MKIVFNDEEKLKYFDDLAGRYYKNFGQMSKTSIDVLMFHYYMQAVIDRNKDDDGVIDFVKCSDHAIGVSLGLTDAQVRNLKIKSQLLYPIEYDWKKAFAKLIQHGRYDEITHKIVISIPDPNLLLDIQNHIEEEGGYIEKQLNGKVLQIRVEYFLDLLYIIEPERKQKEIRKEIGNFLKKNNYAESFPEKYPIGMKLLEAGVNITEILANVSGWFSPDNILIKAFLALFS